jgi:hypothetical protein
MNKCMNDSEHHASAIARCEAIAGRSGHTLGAWHLVKEELYGSVCEKCSALAWVSRQSGEHYWQIGGSALEQECVEGVWWLAFG